MFMALRTSTTEPIAPTAPQSKPRATDGGTGSSPGTATSFTPSCRLSFKVTRPPFTCDKIEMTPNETSINSGGDSRILTVISSGGVGSLTYSWTVTGGNLSANNLRTVTWTAPQNLVAGQSWTIVATVTDSTGRTATGDNCRVQLSYNPGCNTACTTSAGCPSDLACINGRCRNPSCSDRADCKCPPPKKACNDTCTVNSDCESQYICAGGNCRNPACITEPTCVCKPPPPPTPTCNSVCTTSADCPSNLDCINGRCRNPACPERTNCICPTPTCNSVCTTSAECPSNLACINGRCRNSECPERTNCVCPAPTPQTHRECRGTACVVVAGPGVDTCTSDASCAPPPAPPKRPDAGNPLITTGIVLGGLFLLAVGLLAAF